RVAFIRGRLGGPNTSSTMSLYVEASDGRGVRRLAVCGACGEQWGGRLGWSPDGTRIAFSRDAGPTGQESLWVVAATRGRPRRLTDCRPAWCADVDPVWSPNGQLLAFRRTALASPGDLYTVRPDGSGLTRIASGADPQWSPDGRRIAFDEKDSIAVANADGSNVHVLV